MKIVFRNTYKSIKPFDDIEVPDFSIITGVNGSGKSQLLEAIKRNNAQIEGVEPQRVVLYRYGDFEIPNQGSMSARHAEEVRYSVWNAFAQQSRSDGAKQKIARFVETQDPTDIYSSLTELSKNCDVPLFEVSTEQDLTEEQSGWLERYREVVASAISSIRDFPRSASRNALLDLARSERIGIHELSEFEFVSRIRVSEYPDVLPKNLSQIFMDYHAIKERNQYQQFLYSRDQNVSTALSDDDFVRLHGPPPWEIVNDILGRLRNFRYVVNCPQTYDRNSNYTPGLVDREDQEVVLNFSDLSSGEKVLLALVVSVYSSNQGDKWPDVILLDEIDASLHPTATRELLRVIRESFLSRGMKVILVTHSPTTVALAPDCSIHMLYPNSKNLIRKAEKSVALDTLSEGFITLEKGIKVFDQLSKSDVVVLTEGRNAKYVSQALSLFGVGGVEVIEDILDRSSSSQLKTLYDFFVSVPHDTNVVILWDCDVEVKIKRLEERNNTTPFVFARNMENNLAQSGIENLFGEELMSGFKVTVSKSQGEVNEYFDESRKKDFEKFILGRKSKHDFRLFEAFIRKILAIKESRVQS